MELARVVMSRDFLRHFILIPDAGVGLECQETAVFRTRRREKLKSEVNLLFSVSFDI
jgi:hypothetical protein